MLALDEYALDYNRKRLPGTHRKGINPRLLADSRREHEVELCLLRTYIRLVVSLNEVRQIAHFVARIVETILIADGYVVFTMLINLIYNNFRIPTTQMILLFNAHFITNPLMFILSYAFAHTIKLEKIGWSILSEIAIYQDNSAKRQHEIVQVG